MVPLIFSQDGYSMFPNDDPGTSQNIPIQLVIRNDTVCLRYLLHCFQFLIEHIWEKNVENPLSAFRAQTLFFMHYSIAVINNSYQLSIVFIDIHAAANYYFLDCHVKKESNQDLQELLIMKTSAPGV